MNKRYLVEKSTVKDTKTGLMWHRYGSRKAMTWEYAYNHCSRLRTGRFSDWRLPTIKELITLIDFSRHDPATEFPHMNSSYYYWSSTINAFNADYAWHVRFYYGRVNNSPKTSIYYVRAVRSDK